MSGFKCPMWPDKPEWLSLPSRGLIGPMWLGSEAIPRNITEEPDNEADHTGEAAE